jgi:mono/diheme cytochrome c family protein
MIEKYVTPAELKRLISALLVVLLFIGLAALFGFIVVPGLRYQAYATADTVVKGTQAQTGWLDPTDYPAAHKKVIPPLDPKDVMTPTPKMLEEGKETFLSTCVSCHGPEGKGDGPAAKGLNPQPRNFTVQAGWKNGSRIEDIYKTLNEGIKGSAMVAYQDLSRKKRMALVHYVRSLGTFDHGASDPKALAELANSFATTSETIPNRIPVRQAMDKLTKEFQPVHPITTTNPLVSDYVLDRSKAAQTLSGMTGWQTSDEIFAKGVVATLPGNGFTPAVATCTSEQWKQLRLALSEK